MRVYACKQLQVQISPRFYTQTLWHKQFWDFLSVFSIGSMVSGQFCLSKSEGGLVNQREGQIITEYLAVLVGKQDWMWNYTIKYWYFDWERPHALNQGYQEINNPWYMWKFIMSENICAQEYWLTEYTVSSKVEMKDQRQFKDIYAKGPCTNTSRGPDI